MSIQVLVGNSLEVLPTLQRKVHCSVTSPPYYGLRKYQGDQQCDWPKVEYSPMPGLPPITVEPMTCALGHEPTIEAYVGHLVAIYREVWQVLRDDGVAWIVMGDSFSGGNYRGGGRGTASAKQQSNAGTVDFMASKATIPNGLQQGDLMLVPHRLALALQGDGWLIRNDVVWQKKSPMPESVSGWRWQRHRVKVKKSERATPDVYTGNVMSPQSQVRGPARNYDVPQVGNWIDCPGCPKCENNGGYVLKRGSWRHTRAHEVVLQLTKKMGYFADQEKAREPNSPTTGRWGRYPGTKTAEAQAEVGGKLGSTSGIASEMDKDEYVQKYYKSGRNPRSVLTANEPLMTLRGDLTNKERKYIMDRLDSLGLL